MYTSKNWQPEVARLDQKSRQYILHGTLKNKQMKLRQKIGKIREYQDFGHNHQNLIPLLVEFADKALRSYVGHSNSQSPYSLIFDARLKLTKKRCVNQMFWFMMITCALIAPISIAILYAYYDLGKWMALVLGVMVGLLGRYIFNLMFEGDADIYKCVGMHPSIGNENEFELFHRMTLFYELFELLPAFMQRSFTPCTLGKLYLAIREQAKSIAENIQKNIHNDTECEPLRTRLKRLINLAIELKLEQGDPSIRYKEAFASKIPQVATT